MLGLKWLNYLTGFSVGESPTILILNRCQLIFPIMSQIQVSFSPKVQAHLGSVTDSTSSAAPSEAEFSISH